MKTTILAIAVFCLIAGATSSASSGTVPTMNIVHKGDTSSVYLVNYFGSKTGRVTVRVKDNDGGEVLIRTYKNVRDFSLPLNFSSALEGTYTVQIEDGADKIYKTLNYSRLSTPTYSRVENLGNGLYLLTASHSGKEQITVRVYSESGVAVYEAEKSVKGDYSLLFDLSKVTGHSYFEITDDSGTFILIPGHPRTIVVKE